MEELHTTTEAIQAVGMSPHLYYNRKRRGDPIPQPSARIGRRDYWTAVDIEALRRYYQAQPEWKRAPREAAGV
jgi:hypothetical protein